MPPEHDAASRLTECLKDLHLPAIRECYLEQSDMARRESLTYEQFRST